MPAELSIEIAPRELAQIVEAVFGSMMSLQVRECATRWFAAGDRLTSAVHLAGDWNGAVLFECSRSQACRFSGRFLAAAAPAIDTAKTVDDDVRDVLGELANMIGGNLKCELTAGNRLSMPSVVDGSDYSLRVCRAQLRERLAFRCDGRPFWVTVIATRS